LKEILAIDRSGNYPERYGSYSAANYLLSLMLTSPKEIKKFFTEQEPLLTTKAKQVLTFWKEQPGFWLFFAIKELLKDDFLTIEDLLTGETHLLYSKGICDMQRDASSRYRHYLCFILPNGECLQTAGLIRYNSLSASDLLFYCSLFEKEGSLTEIVKKHYPKFFLLDEISTIPPTMHKNEPVQFIFQPFTVQEFDLSKLGGVWETETKGKLKDHSLLESDESMQGVPNASLLKSDFPWTSATIFEDTETGELALLTKGLTSYNLFSSLLCRSYPELTLPEKPDYAISMVLLSLLNRMDVTLPWDHFKTLLTAEEEPEDKNAALSKVNRLLQTYSQSKNEGKTLDLKAFCKKEGMDLTEAKEIVQTMEKQFEKVSPSFQVSFEDKAFELADWPVPPPVKRHSFSSGLFESELFDLDDSSMVRHKFEILTGGAFTDEIEEAGLLEFLENMFFASFDYDQAFTLFNSFFYILYYKGKEWVPVRSYALEILKLFPYPLLETYPDSEVFISTFSEFVKRTLCSRGICLLSSRPKHAEVAKGTYTIKATDAFFALLKPWE
jgi:hypothetical protein